MPIIPAHLKTLRLRKKLSREKLAELAKVNPRTVQRYESDAGAEMRVRPKTLVALGRALGVNKDVLTGAADMPAEGHDALENAIEIKVDVSQATLLEFDLIEMKYGVERDTLIRLAPMMFVLLAESSLADRKEKLAQARQETLTKSSYLNPLSYFFVEYIDEILRDEELSIDAQDVFGKIKGSHAFKVHELRKLFYREDFDELQQGYDSVVDNPFVVYIDGLVDKVTQLSTMPDAPPTDSAKTENTAHESSEIVFSQNFGTEITRFDDEETIPSYVKFAEYRILRPTLMALVGRSELAQEAICRGDVKINSIPKQLMGPDATEARIAWIEEQASDKLKATMKEEDNDEYVYSTPDEDGYRHRSHDGTPRRHHPTELALANERYFALVREWNARHTTPAPDTPSAD